LTGPILLVWPDGCLSDSVRLGRLGCERRPQCSALGRSLFPPGLVPGCAPGSLEQSKLRPKALGLSCKNETWRLETAARTACSPCPAVFVSGSMGLGSSPPPPLVIGTVASPLMVLAAGRRLRHPLLRNDRGSLELHGPVPNNGQSSLIREQCLTVDTPHPRIVLAGDGICCDFPVALMERAAMTGFLAANQLLSIYMVWPATISGQFPSAHATGLRLLCTASSLVWRAFIVLAIAVLRRSDLGTAYHWRTSAPVAGLCRCRPCRYRLGGLSCHCPS
jgi:hypothetical protein